MEFELEYLIRLKRSGYNWIARDKNGWLYAYISKPIKGIIEWGESEETSDIFEFMPGIMDLAEVQWPDKEPVFINELIARYRAAQAADESSQAVWMSAEQPPKNANKVNIIIRNQWGDQRIAIGKYSNGHWYRDGRLAMEMVMDIVGELVIAWNPIPRFIEEQEK